MSEYQYYEFRTVDRPLTKQEMGKLRALSTRTEITSTSFVNIIQTKRPTNYDQAVKLLLDLRDLAVQRRGEGGFNPDSQIEGHCSVPIR
jgi:hypothetical protein